MAELGGRVICDYMLGPKIASGSFAVVWRGRLRHTRMEVAVKEIDKQQLSPKVHDSLLKEIAILRHGSHANIVRFHHAILTEERIYLVLEYCDGGDLAAHIQRSVARHFMRIFFCQICGASVAFDFERLVLDCGAGLAVGMYSGLTYGLKEAHGSHDWNVEFL
ncbi:hypothetical protein J5N97_004739 [Dioscorea zingiberensis]|uniref:Protein kinase domain-containing protein n=1 Tax=Dioscorea zingiberensis TaxID=325984 RepID=A0A9D5D783_9LILI|nr:hypothetical protein J5N97_004739 [Dioscorea zingiberensis]